MADKSEDDDKNNEKNADNQPASRHPNDSVPLEAQENVGNSLAPSTLAPGGQSIPPQVRKKTSSFQITSVTQSRLSLSHDGGEDSADDLDESHTEELSSEILDCSKATDIDNDGASSEDVSASIVVNNSDDVHINSNTTQFSNTVQVMPTDLTKILPQVSIAVSVPIFEDTVSVNSTSNPIDVVPTELELPQPPVESELHNQQWGSRFKVVKIANKEPFNRGRWLVMDYMDPAPAVPTQSADPKSEPNSTATEGIGSGNSSAGSSVHYIPNESQQSETNTVIHDGVQSSASAAPPQPSVAYATSQSQVNPSQAQAGTNVSQSTSTAVQQQQNSIVSNSTPTLPNAVPNNQQSGAPCSKVQSSHPIASQGQQVPNTVEPPAVTIDESVSNLEASDLNGPTSLSNSKDSNSNSIDEEPSTISAESVNQESSGTPVLKPLLDALPDTLGVAPDGDEAESFLAFAAVLSGSTSPCIIGEEGDNGIDVQSQHSMAEGGWTANATRQQIYRKYSCSASGSSTVAIDNKIEQAMDLVKSHLMFAVREEVDVLKEKITELVDRISQLELENGILKASASQETLNKLSSQPATLQTASQTQPSNTSQQTSTTTAT